MRPSQDDSPQDNAETIPEVIGKTIIGAVYIDSKGDPFVSLLFSDGSTFTILETQQSGGIVLDFQP